MRELSLDHFGLPQGQKHHIYRIGGSEVSQQAHCHDYYQICYVECGQIQHWQDDAPVVLSAGDAFIVPPGFVHRVVFPDENAFMYSLSFSEALFHPGFSHSNVYRFMTALKLDTLEEQRLDIRMKIHLSQAQRSVMKSLLDCLITEGQTDCPRELSAAASLVSAILCVLSQGYFAGEQRQELLRSVERYSKTMEACLAYIDSHFTQSLTLGGLAHDFAISRSRFSLLFPQFTGMTLKRYIAKKRIDYAVTLTQTTSLSIQQIAAMVGYEDISTFYRNFTKVTGAPPSAFRPDIME